MTNIALAKQEASIKLDAFGELNQLYITLKLFFSNA